MCSSKPLTFLFRCRHPYRLLLVTVHTVRVTTVRPVTMEMNEEYEDPVALLGGGWYTL